uniref:WD repeat-containing protein 44 n=1 Tax=Tetraselmis chuii TaxID=63592 RepID=A0A7S1T0F1_9CHLO|mmetsp:Transcript_38115/g.68375  ORF Transcript_38115/g.68375 Transcript_38115/m.68375 type:complete len:322 (+) Transcript_38115:346-1311(+)
MDKTVRLWHVSVDGECLRTFNHTDFVTCVQFHPSNDKVFMSGSIDGKVRLWNIPRIHVLDFADCHQMVTAASFSPDGDQVAVGTMAGKCRFYACRDTKLTYEAQLNVCTVKGRNRKITGIRFMPTDKTKVLITSNDSRLRLYNTTEYQQCCKYKGLINKNAQIRASFSGNGRYILCGSDQGQVFVWSTVNPLIPAVNPSYTAFRKDKNSSYEAFQGLTDIATVALFAPELWHRRFHEEAPEHVAPVAELTKAVSALLRTDTAAGVADSPLSGDSPAGGNLDSAAKGSELNSAFSMFGEVIVAAGHRGEICIFENSGLPHWL